MNIRWFENQNPGWTMIRKDEVFSIESQVTNFFIIRTTAGTEVQAIYLEAVDDHYKVQLN